MDDSTDSHDSTPAPNSPASPLLDEEKAQRSVVFSPEAPAVREVSARKTEPSISSELKKWYDNPPSEVWLVLSASLVLLLIAIIVIIVMTVNYNSLVEESKNACRLSLRRRADDDDE